MRVVPDIHPPDDPTGEVHAELERVQRLLHDERSHSEGLERKLAAIQKPPSERARLFPFIVALVAGVLIGLMAYRLLELPIDARRGTTPPMPMPLRGLWP